MIVLIQSPTLEQLFSSSSAPLTIRLSVGKLQVYLGCRASLPTLSKKGRFVMYNASSLFSNSQSVSIECDSTGQAEIKPSRDAVRLILDRECDQRDLLGAYHVGYHTKKYGKGADISDLMPIMGLSNPATNVRLRRMSGDLKAGGLKIPILRRSKTGPYGSHLYFLNEDVVTLEEIKAVMVSKGINYEQYITQLQEGYLRVVDSDDTVNEEERSGLSNKDEANSLDDYWVDSSDDLSLEDSCEDKQVFREKENTKIKESEFITNDSTSNYTGYSKQATSNDASLSRNVTLGEVLKIVDIATGTFVEQFNKEIAKRDARITELERQLALYQDSQHTSTNHTEEILDTVRFSVLSKFGEFSSERNGKAHN